MKVDAWTAELRRLLRRRDDVQRRIALLQRKAHIHRRARLKALPAQFGFATLTDLVRELQTLTPRTKGKLHQAVPKSFSRQRGVRYDAALRARVRQALKSGTPASTVAQKLGPSVATVNTRKKKFSLTKPRFGRRKSVAATRSSRLNGNSAQGR